MTIEKDIKALEAELARFNYRLITLAKDSGGAIPWTEDGNDLYWDGTGYVTIGAIAPDSKMTVAGLTIYTPATADTLHFAIQNADVAHGFTSYADADTYYAIQKYHSTEGGASIVGMGEVTVGVEIKGGGDTDNITKSSAGIAPIILNATKAVGGTFASVGADGNLVAMQNFGSSVWILDEDGDVWQNGVLHVPNMKTGIDQADAGASAGELYVDTDDDNTIKMGV